MSLQRISLRDFVIVRQLELEFGAGFTVLSGETGAGKSILIDALQLVLGARAEASVVREGAARSELCAEFSTPAHLQPWLQDNGFDAADDLLLKRSIDAQGKSRAWINGSPATATQLREIGDQLLDIHGQHAWQSLTRPSAVRDLLDAYAQIPAQALQTLWNDWRQSLQTLEHARLAQDQLQQERERLSWQIGEVDKLAPGADEWEDLNAQHTRLSHAQTLLDAAQTALTHLQEEDAAHSHLAQAVKALQEQANIEAEFQQLSDQLGSALAQAEDAAHSLQAWLRRADLDPQGLADIDARMGLWVGLSRRYKRTPQELPALYLGWQHSQTLSSTTKSRSKVGDQHHPSHAKLRNARRSISSTTASPARTRQPWLGGSAILGRRSCQQHAQTRGQGCLGGRTLSHRLGHRSHHQPVRHSTNTHF